MTEREILKSALKKVEAQQDELGGFMDRFDIPEHWAVRKALEKQIPKKPEMQQNRYDDDVWECSSCGAFLGYEVECREESYQMNYCPHCGQRILWEDSEV